FFFHFHNDQNSAHHSMASQVAAMLMTNVREIRKTGAWQSYRNALGVFEWREHEFDYFLAANLTAPRELARLVRDGSIPDWAELVNMTNPGTGKQGATRRPVDEVAAQIRQGIPGGHGNPERWVEAARTGFGDSNDQVVAADPKQVKKAVKAGNITAAKRPAQLTVSITHTRNESLTLDGQRAEMIVAWLEKNPAVRDLVKKALD
ncbi:MAG TPA: hypothetical protein VLL25_04340, partial [Acidimicrobiales bacterium]|nr:hypothetical protein [Acidimicrobiales bacterium]